MAKEPNKIFADRILALLKENGLSIAQLASLSKIPRTTLNNWLVHHHNPNLDALCKLALHFQCSIDYLVGLEDEFGGKLY
ncbi:MAG: helix-turn-helix domain-containing protein [Firmicutes bacterium]|nr:helix-turn-helix domain-containing protein [Bacillota bacterium]